MATSKTSEIILGRVEYINASHFNCLSFAKASDGSPDKPGGLSI